jgi:tetratricopeptide (TPR) repeat protein
VTAAALLVLAGLAAPPTPESLARLRQATQLLDQGQPIPALDIVDDVLSRQAGIPEALMLRGLALDALGRHEEADAAFRSAAEISPRDHGLLRYYGAYLLRRGRLAEALAVFERGLALAPDDTETLLLAAQAHFELGELAEALEAIEKCARLAPENPAIRSVRERYRTASAAGRRAATGSGDPYARVQRAKQHLELGDPAKALAVVDGLLREYPQSPSSHLLRGLALDELGRLDEAEESYAAALKSAPGDAQILTRFGMHCIRRKAWPDAIRYLEAGSRAEPKAETFFYLAQSYFHTDHKAKALEAIERAATMAPEEPAMLVKLGEYRAHAGRFSPALEALLAARALAPDEPGLDLALGVVQLSLLDVDAAREALERARTREPDDLAVLSNLAAAHAKARDHAAAREHFQRLLDLGQDEAEYYVGLGAARAGLGESEAAIRALNEAVDRNPSLAEAHFHLARAYRATGRPEEAERELRVFSALKASPFPTFGERSELERSLWQRAEEMVRAGKETEALELLAGGNAPDNDPRFLVGALYYSLGQFEDASRLLAQAMEENAERPKLRAYLGLAYLKQGSTREAEPLLRAEVEQNPREPLALMALGELCFTRGEWADAARHLEDSRVIVPEALLMLCEAQLRLGRRADAQGTAQLVVTLASDSGTQTRLRQLLARFDLPLESELPGPGTPPSP